MANSIRLKVDNELTRRVGKWFTVREIQEKLQINPSTLKPLIMKYARESLLRRRHVKGTARSVQFSPAAGSVDSFRQLLTKNLPYRNLSGGVPAAKVAKTPAKSSKVAAPKAKSTKTVKVVKASKAKSK